jgi:cohesin loading factor subunit SCC2
MQYYEHIAERIKDLGVSVRKRVIRIIREVYLEREDLLDQVNPCERLITRINDEETSIQVRTLSLQRVG